MECELVSQLFLFEPYYPLCVCFSRLLLQRERRVYRPLYTHITGNITWLISRVNCGLHGLQMSDLIRDSPIGQLIRFITKNRVLLYPEEKPGFQCPTCYANPDAAAQNLKSAIASYSSDSAGLSTDDPADVEKAGVEPAEEAESPVSRQRPGVDRLETSESSLERAATAQDFERRESLQTSLSRVGTRTALRQSETRADLENAFRAATLEKGPTMPIIPQRTSDGTILVDWYTTDDPVSALNSTRVTNTRVHMNEW